MTQLSWPQLRRQLMLVINVIILTQLHLIISAPTSAVTSPADDVTGHVTPSSWERGDDVTERRETVHSNAAVSSASVARRRRQLNASQGCGPVCNRCRQVLVLDELLRCAEAQRAIVIDTACMSQAVVTTTI